jgi:hypothetical protein
VVQARKDYLDQQEPQVILVRQVVQARKDYLDQQERKEQQEQMERQDRKDYLDQQEPQEILVVSDQQVRPVQPVLMVQPGYRVQQGLQG